MTTGANGSGGTTAADDTDERMPPPGALLAEEMRLLLDALADRAQPWLSHLSGVDGTASAEPHIPATCGWCPLCAGLAVLRGERPELAVRAAEHAAGLLSVLRSALADHTPPPRSGPSPNHHWTDHDQARHDQAYHDQASRDPGRQASHADQPGRADQTRQPGQAGRTDEAKQGQPTEPGRVQHITVRRRGESDDHDGDSAC